MNSPLNLDGIRMHAIKTAPNGAVNADTYFNFHQAGSSVWADYAGGRVVRGYLVGKLDGNELEFRYCQHEAGDIIRGGSSNCVVKQDSNSPAQLIERFAWESGGGHGVNVIQEVVEL